MAELLTAAEEACGGARVAGVSFHSANHPITSPVVPSPTRLYLRAPYGYVGAGASYPQTHAYERGEGGRGLATSTIQQPS